MKSHLLYLFLIASSLQLVAQDALTTGNRIIGGGLSFSHQDDENDAPVYTYYDIWYPYPNYPYYSGESKLNGSSFSFSPYYGRIYEDNKMVGLRFNYSGNTTERIWEQENSETINEVSAKSFGIGAFHRNYFPANDKFGLFLQAGINLNRSINTEEVTYRYFDDINPPVVDANRRETRSVGVSADAYIGIYYFLLPQLSIETNLGQFELAYSKIKTVDEYTEVPQNNDYEGSKSSVNFNLINQFSLDKVFTINYYF